MEFRQIFFLYLCLNYIHGVQLPFEYSKTSENIRVKNPTLKSSEDNFQRSKDLKREITNQDSLQEDFSDTVEIQTRLTTLEDTQSDIIKSLNKFIQTSVETRDKIIENLANMNIQMKTIGNEIKSLNTEIEYMKNSNCSKLDDQTDLNQLQEDIHSIKRLASLLALTQINFKELPYTSHCENDHETVGFQSRMDVCIQNRLDQRLRDYENVLDFHVMLVGGSGPHEGTVKIVYQGMHGTICSRYWDFQDAKVVCKMLGYKGARRSYGNSHFGNGTGEILMDEVACTGNEGSLLACKHRGIGGDRNVFTLCNHGDDAGVTCRK